MEQGMDQTRDAVRLNPDNVIAVEDLLAFQLSLDRFDEARQLYQQTIARKLDDDTLHIVLYAVEFDEKNPKGMAEQAAWFEGRPELQHEILAQESDTEAYSGHVAK